MPLVSIPRSIASESLANIKATQLKAMLTLKQQGEAEASLPKAMPTLKQHNLKPC